MSQWAKTVGKVALIVAMGMSLEMAVIATRADAIMFSASSPDGKLRASVEFVASEINPTDLMVTLTNTSTVDVFRPSDVLTAVFFTLAGNPTLTPVSAVLADGSTVLFAPAGGSGPDVGGEWAYEDGLTGAPLGAREGISSAGLGLFGPKDLFPPMVNLQGPLSPGGLQYGITSATDDPTTGNSAVKGGFALIQNSVMFTLSGLTPGYLTEGTITNISFQYGTSLRDPNVPVPEPGTLVLLGSGLVGVTAFGRRLRKRG
jgi:hypothetical protein